MLQAPPSRFTWAHLTNQASNIPVVHIRRLPPPVTTPSEYVAGRLRSDIPVAPTPAPTPPCTVPQFQLNTVAGAANSRFGSVSMLVDVGGEISDTRSDSTNTLIDVGEESSESTSASVSTLIDVGEGIPNIATAGQETPTLSQNSTNQSSGGARTVIRSLGDLNLMD